MESKKKLNNGCIRAFKFLMLLYEDNAYYNNVIEIFKDEISEQSANNIQVTLNKYINTLKVFGINIKKEKNKYKLLNSIYSMNFTPDDLKSISILITSKDTFPNKETTKEITKFIQNIELRMKNSDKYMLNSLINTSEYDFSFYYSDIKTQVENCEKACKEKQVLDIIYYENNEQIRCTCYPQEVIYDSKTAYLKAHDSKNRQSLEIPVNNIIKITSLPNIANNNVETNTTVVYKLKDRLSKIYKPKENEYIQDYDNDGNIIIINKDEPFDKLVKRLMRYSYSCEIISPKNVRNMIIKTINNSISNYTD